MVQNVWPRLKNLIQSQGLYGSVHFHRAGRDACVRTALEMLRTIDFFCSKIKRFSKNKRLSKNTRCRKISGISFFHKFVFFREKKQNNFFPTELKRKIRATFSRLLYVALRVALIYANSVSCLLEF